MPRKSSGAVGFTLVEVLLVVTVIAVLISLLLPMMARARHQALQVLCSTYHENVGVGMVTFALDHNRRFPRNPANNTGYGPALYQINNDKTTNIVEQMRRYVGTFKIFTCPMNDQIPQPDHPSNNGPTLVWAFWYLGNYRHNSGAYVSKVTGVNNPGNWSYYGDIMFSHGSWIGPYDTNHLVTGAGSFNPVQTAFPGSPTARWFVINDTSQILGANVLKVDGSVEFTQIQALQQVVYGSISHWYGKQQ